MNYLDAVIEQQMSMTAASTYWIEHLHNYKIDRSLLLPFDRHRLSNEHDTGYGTSITFDFGQDLSQLFVTYSSLYNIKFEYLTLACYYVFLFKLSNGEKDLCIGMNIDNRYRKELKSLIGLFEIVIPLRCQLDPHWSFHQHITHTKEMMTNSLQYSYFPLQRILNQHLKSLKPAFLNIFFEFQSNQNEYYKNEIMIGDIHLYTVSYLNQIGRYDTVNKYDFSLNVQYDFNINQLLCTINASLDLFNEETIEKTTQRFHFMLKQLFISTDDWMKKPIYYLSLILPNERLITQSLNKTEVLFPSVTCIHHEFVFQVMKHSQKLAVELDEQFLSYSELLHCVQLLTVHLLNNHDIVVGQIVCQCVERSLSMVS